MLLWQRIYASEGLHGATSTSTLTTLSLRALLNGGVEVWAQPAAHYLAVYEDGTYRLSLSVPGAGGHVAPDQAHPGLLSEATFLRLERDGLMSSSVVLSCSLPWGGVPRVLRGIRGAPLPQKPARTAPLSCDRTRGAPPSLL